MIWNLKKNTNDYSITELASELNINSVLVTLLVQRKITNFEEAKDFFRPQLEHLHDPFLMKDMQKAVDRIEKAIQEQKNILVYGDYDVDGTTSVSVVYMFLQSIYGNVTYYIPDRYNEGYGISKEGIDFADDNDIDLIIALDCGIKAIQQIEYANSKNIDFIICDHHLPGEKVPDAFAILNPKQKDCSYPYKELSGCGVGFKLIQGLTKHLNFPIEKTYEYLDLVAISIAADIVPIDGENRVLAFYGIQKINTNASPAIRALLGDRKPENTTISNVVFSIAPKINAAGRMKHAHFSVELLTAPDSSKIQELNTLINSFNKERRFLDKKITDEALEFITTNQEENKYTSVVYQEDWHKGVLGIVASRLIDTYYRPTIVMTKSKDVWVGSVRSVKNFDVHQALEKCAEYIEQFGGHKYAAGLNVLPEKLIEFKNAFEKVVKESIEEGEIEPSIDIDTVVGLNDIDPKFVRVLKQFAPFGPKNMNPVFMVRKAMVVGYPVGVGNDKTHLKMQVKSFYDKILETDQKAKSTTFNCIGFGLGHLAERIYNERVFKMAFMIEENHFRGKTSLQLNIKDIQFID